MEMANYFKASIKSYLWRPGWQFLALLNRNKLGNKKHILSDKNGIPLSAVITSAHTDVTVAIDTFDIIIIKRR